MKTQLNRTCLHYAYAVNNGDMIAIIKATNINKKLKDSVSIRQR